MQTNELNIKIDNLSSHISILDYDLKLSDTDITWLEEDYDFCYDSYFDKLKGENENDH